ncbi:hypothetical protein Cgig2_002178 [Carnegiea gigantea]|uniref:Uncharacterized protein n=1 Tax=Carnegiea gigantea TaxID=171969 RepID=A0A9Q1QPK1_9CARY|nr:hypothetical protein Cgig2_002178 [Carnegiea gigantea]
MSSVGARKLCVYFFWGGYVQEEEDGKVSYQGGSRDCVLLSESMSLDEAKSRLMRRVGSASKEEKLWYTLKFDRKIFLPLDADDAVEAMFMGNEEHAFVYMGGREGPLLRKKGDPEPGMEGVLLPDNGGLEDRPCGGNEERVQSVMPDEDASEQAAAGASLNCDERIDSVERGSSTEGDGEGQTGGGAKKRLRSSTNRDNMIEDRRDISASGGYSNSSSSEGSVTHFGIQSSKTGYWWQHGAYSRNKLIEPLHSNFCSTVAADAELVKCLSPNNGNRFLQKNRRWKGKLMAELFSSYLTKRTGTTESLSLLSPSPGTSKLFFSRAIIHPVSLFMTLLKFWAGNSMRRAGGETQKRSGDRKEQWVQSQEHEIFKPEKGLHKHEASYEQWVSMLRAFVDHGRAH